jgi:hypothetical protein
MEHAEYAESPRNMSPRATSALNAILTSTSRWSQLGSSATTTNCGGGNKLGCHRHRISGVGHRSAAAWWFPRLRKEYLESRWRRGEERSRGALGRADAARADQSVGEESGHDFGAQLSHDFFSYGSWVNVQVYYWVTFFSRKAL